MILSFLAVSAGAVALIAAAAVYCSTSKILSEIENMLDRAVSGTFSQISFSEKRSSKIESKMYRYLSLGAASLEQINYEKDNIKTLISDISHQTKTPIANIMLYSGLLREKICADERDERAGNAESSGSAAELADEIIQQSEKLNFLISSLIKISRLENGIVNVSPEVNSVNRLIQSSVGAAGACAKGVSFIINAESISDKNDIQACFDMKWTAEALSNIIDNAVKYTPEGGEVRVSVREYEMFACINVADTGIGISEEETAKIFTRFYRSPEVYGEKGVGIGLYLAREIISKQHGYIKVVSKKGEGSVFSVYLPKNIYMTKL